MTTHFGTDVTCRHCRTQGIVFWAEADGPSSNRCHINAIWGAFVVASDREFAVRCDRCGRLAEPGSSRQTTPDQELQAWRCK
jgi:hypothetical protein